MEGEGRVDRWRLRRAGGQEGQNTSLMFKDEMTERKPTAMGREYETGLQTSVQETSKTEPVESKSRMAEVQDLD